MFINALDVLDITKTPLEMIIDKVNVISSKQLVASEFVLSAPTPVVGGEGLTSIRLLPVMSSVYYNGFQVTYNRVLLSALFAFDSDLSSNDSSTLYQFLPYINAAYGVNILQSDIYDAEIDYTQDGNNESLGTVVIKAKPDSVLFFGEAVVRVNVISSDGVGVNEDDRVYYAVTNSNIETVGLGYQIELESCNTIGDTPAEFSFLGDEWQLYATDTITPPLSYKTPENNFVIMGANMVMQKGSDTGTKRPITRIEVDARGALVDSDSTAILVKPNAGYQVDHYSERIYVVSDTYSSITSNFIVLNGDGSYNSTLNSVLSNKQVRACALANDKSVYAVTQNSPGSNTIYRLDNEGAIHPDFTPIEIGSALAVVNGLAVIDEFLYATVETTTDWDVQINGTPTLPDGVVFGKGKMLLRFNAATGAPDNTFNQLIPEYPAALAGHPFRSNLAAITPLTDYLVIPAYTSISPTGSITRPWFVVYDKSGELITTGWASSGALSVIEMQAYCPISAHEFLAAVSKNVKIAGVDTPTVSLQLFSRAGVASEELVSFTNKRVLSIMMVNPDDIPV